MRAAPYAGRRPGRDGLFVYAQGGTLFLDEIGDLPLPLQATLLRVLEDGRIRPVGSEQLIPVDLRIVAATNRRLADEVAAGRFRADLYPPAAGGGDQPAAAARPREDIPGWWRTSSPRWRRGWGAAAWR